MARGVGKINGAGEKMKTEAVRNKMKKKGKGKMKRKKRKIGFYIKKKTTSLFAIFWQLSISCSLIRLLKLIL